MIYTIYDPNTGQITGTITVSSIELAEINLRDRSYVSGSYDAMNYYVDHGQVLKLPHCENPSQHTFDWTTKTWQLNLDLISAQLRDQRNTMLSRLDRVNPVWFNTLSPAQQQELIQYRQALLDVPQQSGFPQDVQWPVQPTWL